MRIAVVTYVLSTHSGARSGIEIGQMLAKRHHEVTIFFTPGLFDASLAKILTRQSHITLIQVSSPFQLYRDLKTTKFDLVSFHGTPLYLIACRLSGTIIFSHYYGSQFNPISEYSTPATLISRLSDLFFNPLVYLATLLLIWLPQHLYGISNYCSREARQLFGRSTRTIYLGTSNLDHAPTIRRSKIINLLSVSRITPYKQFEKIIQIVKSLNLQHVHLTIIGSSPKPHYLAYLQTLATSNIHIKINVSDSQLTKYFQQTDIYLTADKYLFFGLPVFEAASFGIPTIAMDYAAASEVIVPGQTGYVASTSAQFQTYLRKLVTDPNLRRKLGHQAKIHNKRFTWDKTINLLESEYQAHAN